jgi:hypothetical protein
VRSSGSIGLVACLLALWCPGAAPAAENAGTPLSRSDIKFAQHDLTTAIEKEREAFGYTHSADLEIKDALPLAEAYLESALHDLEGHTFGDYDPTPLVKAALADDMNARKGISEAFSTRLAKIADALKKKKAALADVEHIAAYGPIAPPSKGASTTTSTTTQPAHVTGEGSLDRICQSCTPPDFVAVYVSFDATFQSFEVVLPKGFESGNDNLFEHAAPDPQGNSQLSGGSIIGTCSLTSGPEPKTAAMACSSTNPVQAGTTVEFLLETIKENCGPSSCFAPLPDNAGATLYLLAPTKAGPFPLAGPTAAYRP